MADPICILNRVKRNNAVVRMWQFCIHHSESEDDFASLNPEGLFGMRLNGTSKTTCPFRKRRMEE